VILQKFLRKGLRWVSLVIAMARSALHVCRLLCRSCAVRCSVKAGCSLARCVGVGSRQICGDVFRLVGMHGDVCMQQWSNLNVVLVRLC